MTYPHRKLQSFRGILALNVAIAHCVGIFFTAEFNPISADLWQNIQWSALRISTFLANGSCSVALFFMLSGFVLGLSLDRSPLNNIKELVLFYIRRVLRIWPAYAVSLLVILAFLVGSFQYQHWPFASEWFSSFYRQPLTWNLILQNFLMTDTSLNSNTWSLKIEMIGSFFIPFLYYFSRKTSPIGDILLALGFMALSRLVHNPLPIFMLMFYFGLALPKWRDLFNPLNKIPYIQVPFILLYVGLNFIVQEGNFGLLRGTLATVLGFILLGLLAHSTPSRFAWLEKPALDYLGKTSYSFYLFQFISMYILANLLFSYFPANIISQNLLLISLILITANVAISLLIAHWSYQWIEEPSLKLGKMFASKTKTKFNPPSVLNTINPTEKTASMPVTVP